MNIEFKMQFSHFLLWNSKRIYLYEETSKTPFAVCRKGNIGINFRKDILKKQTNKQTFDIVYYFLV